MKIDKESKAVMSEILRAFDEVPDFSMSCVPLVEEVFKALGRMPPPENLINEIKKREKGSVKEAFEFAMEELRKLEDGK